VDPQGQWERVDRIEPRYLGLGELFYRIRDAGIVGDTRTGRVVLWNEAATTMFGYSPSEAADLLIEDLVPESLKDAHRAGLRRFAESGHGSLVDAGTVVELPALKKDGSQVYVELSLTPLESPRLHGRYVLAIVRDVTERQATLERLRKLDELKNMFVATVAHDIRSPMAAVAGFAEILRTGWDKLNDTDRERVIAGIARSAATVDRLVDDVLLVAALQSGEMPYVFRSIDLSSEVADSLDDCRVSHPSLTFEAQISPSLGLIWADPSRLWQVLANLLANAARHSPENGRVEVSAREVGEMVEVSVSDDGPGISPHDQSRLFEPFSTVGEEVEPRGRGTGLGLSICKMIVQAHGGTIWVVSALGGGTTFRFTIPLASR
jgi:PAS domain S-box-containing protein